jgi:hypothetical protein
MQNFLFKTDKARSSSSKTRFWEPLEPAPLVAGPVGALGELAALLVPGLALFGSELLGVGCSSEDKLALWLPAEPLTVLLAADRWGPGPLGGDTDKVRGGPGGAGCEDTGGPCCGSCFT